MSKDNIAQQYNNMVASIEDAKIHIGYILPDHHKF